VTQSEFLWAKKCPDCGEQKPVSEYGRNASRPDGLAFYCRPCFQRRAAATYRRKRQRAGHEVRERIVLPDGMLRCAACGEIKPKDSFALSAGQATGRNCYCKPCNNVKQSESWFRRKYGLTKQALAELIDSQGGFCAICRHRPALHVDHDHLTGEVRGVLCFPCNAALGHFKDRIDLLARAARYLETSTWQKSRVCTGVYRLTSPRLGRRPSSTSSALPLLISSRRGGATSPPV
jgi:hypothetical protein